MNIFLTSSDATACARALDDRRVVKMTLETAQLLSSACRLLMPDASRHLYGITHKNHPCAVWTRANIHNFLWLYDHGVALAMEYQHRFERRHRSLDIIRLAYQHLNFWGYLVPEPEDHVTFDFNSSRYRTGDVFHDYRLTMAYKWRRLDTQPDKRGLIRRPKWTHRSKPEWFLEYMEQV